MNKNKTKVIGFKIYKIKEILVLKFTGIVFIL